MAKHLKYDITERDIKRGAYYPQFYTDAEKDNHEIRQGLAKLTRGEIAVPIAVPGFARWGMAAAQVLTDKDPETMEQLKRIQSAYEQDLAKMLEAASAKSLTDVATSSTKP
jgi:2'-5' RNA ligase